MTLTYFEICRQYFLYADNTPVRIMETNLTLLYLKP